MEFLKSNKRFSLRLGEKNAWEVEYKCEIKEEGDTLITEYFFDGGLKITNVAKKYEKYDAYEWVNYIENTSDTPTEIISELWDCDCAFPMPHENPRKWEALLEKFPNLLIDYCASGGRRIDIETLRRSMPLWRSDYQCPANFDIEASQCHNHTYNTWMPYSGSGSGREYDEYRISSTYAASLTTNYSYSERESFCDTPEKVEFIKKYLTEYLSVRPYFSEDYYPLTEFSDRLDVWMALQFDRAEQNDGLIQVFRRENSPYETACFKLCGLDETGDYLFNDADGGEFTVSGKTLVNEGLKLYITEKRSAKIYFYKKKQN